MQVQHAFWVSEEMSNSRDSEALAWSWEAALDVLEISKRKLEKHL